MKKRDNKFIVLLYIIIDLPKYEFLGSGIMLILVILCAMTLSSCCVDSTGVSSSEEIFIEYKGLLYFSPASDTIGVTFRKDFKGEGYLYAGDYFSSWHIRDSLHLMNQNTYAIPHKPQYSTTTVLPFSDTLDFVHALSFGFRDTLFMLSTWDTLRPIVSEVVQLDGTLNNRRVKIVASYYSTGRL